MGYHLKAENEGIEDYYMGSWSFNWMLDQGVGLVIKSGVGIDPGKTLYEPGPDGSCPRDNNGYPVTAEQAVMMATAAEGLAFIERAKHERWDALSEEERASKTKRRDIYNTPVRDDFIEKTEKFAAWARLSGGFRIC